MIVSLLNANSNEMKIEFMKEIKSRGDNVKKNFRTIRHSHIDLIKKKKEFISKDVIFDAEKETQAIFTDFVAKADKVIKAKEQSIK